MPKITATPENQAVRAAHVQAMKQLLQSGHAGFNQRGRIVDRREFPDAYSLPWEGRPKVGRKKKSN